MPLLAPEALLHRIERGAFLGFARVVAQSFALHLRADGPWASRFDRVVFSIHDSSPGKDTLAAFQRELG